MYVLYTIVASLVSFLILKWIKKRRYCTDLKRLDGKTVLITGKHVVLYPSIMDVCIGYIDSVLCVCAGLTREITTETVSVRHCWLHHCCLPEGTGLAGKQHSAVSFFFFFQVGTLALARTQPLPWQ